MLVEEYRQRYERPSTQDLTPFGPGMGGRRRQRPRRSLGPLFVGLAGVVVLLAALYLLGVVWGDDTDPERDAPPVVSTSTPTPTATATKTSRPSKKKKPTPPPRATLRLTATGARVYVCLIDATGKAVIDGDYIEPGKSSKTFRSQRFRVNLGNSAVTMRVGGKRYSAENTGKPIGYEIRPGKKPKRLKENVRTRLCST
jgi:hypothetical protein